MEILHIPDSDDEEMKVDDYFDDSYILPEHKRELIKSIKQIYNNMYPWADDILMKCLIKHHYKETISKMDKEAYLSEIQSENIDDMI